FMASGSQGTVLAGGADAGEGRRLRSGRVLAFAMAMIGSMQLAGCAGGEFAPTLDFAVPAHFEATKNTAAPQVSRWWTRFGSSELDERIERADIDNLDIAVAFAQLKQADAEAQIAGAPLWPTLDYADNNSRSQSSGTNVPGVINKPSRRNSFEKALSASYI